MKKSISKDYKILYELEQEESNFYYNAFIFVLIVLTAVVCFNVIYFWGSSPSLKIIKTECHNEKSQSYSNCKNDCDKSIYMAKEFYMANITVFISEREIERRCTLLCDSLYPSKQVCEDKEVDEIEYLDKSNPIYKECVEIFTELRDRYSRYTSTPTEEFVKKDCLQDEYVKINKSDLTKEWLVNNCNKITLSCADDNPMKGIFVEGSPVSCDKYKQEFYQCGDYKVMLK